MDFTFDPVIAGIISATIVVIASVIYWNRQLSEQESLASIELQAAANETRDELFDAQYNIKIFSDLQFPLQQEYEKLLAEHNDSHSEVALHQLLLKRSIDCVVKAQIIQQHANVVAQIAAQGQAPAGTMERIQAAVKKVEAEIKVIQSEAELCKEGWGKGIIQQAAQMHAQHIQSIQQRQQQALNAQQQPQQPGQPQLVGPQPPQQPQTPQQTTASANALAQGMPNLANMTPQQRAAFQAAFAQALSKQTPTSTPQSKAKVTEEKQATPAQPQSTPVITPAAEKTSPNKSSPNKPGSSGKKGKSKHAS